MRVHRAIWDSLIWFATFSKRRQGHMCHKSHSFTGEMVAETVAEGRRTRDLCS